MKIGILTYHRSHNFGALFQAVASRFLLVSFGHEVYYIDYWPDYHVAMYSRFSWKEFSRRNFKGKLGYVRKNISEYSVKKKSSEEYKSFIKQYIEPYCKPMGTSFDLILYGSDQIWRKQPWLDTYNPVYFGVHSSTAKIHAAYSASMGILPDSTEKKDLLILKKLLDHFDYISVRENELLTLVKSLGFVNSEKCIDPAIMLTSTQWDSIFPPLAIRNMPKNEYLLYINYIPHSFDENHLRNLASKNHLDFVKINGTVIGKDTPDAIVNSSPLELLEYIRNASVVFSSSFHALIFSILYEKICYAAFSNNGERARSILDDLDLGKYYLQGEELSTIEISPIDYDMTNRNLTKLRTPSMEYLKRVCSVC